MFLSGEAPFVPGGCGQTGWRLVLRLRAFFMLSQMGDLLL